MPTNDRKIESINLRRNTDGTVSVYIDHGFVGIAENAPIGPETAELIASARSLVSRTKIYESIPIVARTRNRVRAAIKAIEQPKAPCESLDNRRSHPYVTDSQSDLYSSGPPQQNPEQGEQHDDT